MICYMPMNLWPLLYGGMGHFEGKKCWQALYKDKTGECEFCPKKHLIDENGLPTKVYSWDYQRPFDKCWFRVFSAAFAMDRRTDGTCDYQH